MYSLGHLDSQPGCALRARLPAFGWCGRRQQRQRWLTEHLPEVYAEVMTL